MDHTAVWTGSEMIVWGGYDQATGLSLNSGGRYRPATNNWIATNVADAPEGRNGHSAVWTGSEMIIWGGFGLFQQPSGTFVYTTTNTGARYDPVTNTWKSMSKINAPSARLRHTAIWTGSEMIVWGGERVGSTTLNTGARYNPATDTWRPMTVANVPASRSLHSAIWTGVEMIVWGGLSRDLSASTVDTGAKYNPSSDTWIATSLTNAPAARYSHSAVWTGNEMIVWGGTYAGPSLNTGSKYNPVTDTWTAASTTNAPARDRHTAIWTGNEMVIWGGASNGPPVNTGARYEPLQDAWTATRAGDAPSARRNHTALWTGSQMLIWGGFMEPPATVNTGGIYCASVPGQLLNISTRMRVLTGNNALIGGFIVSGTDQKKVIVRGIGPSMTSFGVVGALTDPTLELHDSRTTLAFNDNWRDTQEREVRATGLVLSEDLESAIVATLPANNSAYTVLLAEKNGNPGIGLVEIYDLAPSDKSMLANISTRGFVDTDDNVMIGGLIVGSGDRGSTKVVARAIGPSLSSFGISNPLQDPTLELHNGNGSIIATNDNWKTDDAGGSQEDEIRATGLAPIDEREAALLRFLIPDNYTIILRGRSNATGIGLVEVYNLPQ